jgi:hypothetical protein
MDDVPSWIRERGRQESGAVPKLPKHISGPFPVGYRSEVDITQALEEEQFSSYQSQIGVLHWIVELGRFDIVKEVSCLVSHLALPRKAHLEAMFHLSGFLKKKPNGTIILDPKYPDIDLSKFASLLR